MKSSSKEDLTILTRFIIVAIVIAIALGLLGLYDAYYDNQYAEKLTDEYGQRLAEDGYLSPGIKHDLYKELINLKDFVEIEGTESKVNPGDRVYLFAKAYKESKTGQRVGSIDIVIDVESK